MAREARSGRPRTTRELPPPLPPETRTVGQLVAEAIHVYQRYPWRALLLGVPLAVFDEIALRHGTAGRTVVLLIAAPFFTIVYAAASALVLGKRPSAREWGTALVGGVVVWIPAGLVFPWFAIASVAWLALAGLVVPAAVAEGRGVVASLRRGIVLGRADFVHAAGSLATLVVLFVVTRLALAVALNSQADAATRAAVFLADVVLSPLVFLGAAVLYGDQVARVGSRGRRSRRRDADLPDADHAHREGRADAQVEPGPSA